MGSTRAGRRRFLKVGGTAAGALVVGGAGVWAAIPRVELPERSFPGATDAADRVLVAYATKAGSTAEVGAFLARKLADAGFGVDLRRAANVRSVEGYRGVVVGSAIRAGHWLPEATDFVRAHKAALGARKTGFFTLCMTLRQDTPGSREKVAGYLKPVREVLEPNWSEAFAGKMEYRRLALGPRVIAKAMRVPEGDYRDWQAIGSWAEAITGELLGRA